MITNAFRGEEQQLLHHRSGLLSVYEPRLRVFFADLLQAARYEFYSLPVANCRTTSVLMMAAVRPNAVRLGYTLLTASDIFRMQ